MKFLKVVSWLPMFLALFASGTGGELGNVRPVEYESPGLRLRLQYPAPWILRDATTALRVAEENLVVLQRGALNFNEEHVARPMNVGSFEMRVRNTAPQCVWMLGDFSGRTALECTDENGGVIAALRDTQTIFWVRYALGAGEEAHKLVADTLQSVQLLN